MPRPVTAQTKSELAMADKAGRALAYTKDPVERLRLLCLKRGATGIIGLGKVFRRSDDNRSGDLTHEEFKNGMTDTGLELSDDDMTELFQIFDKDGSGTIQYDEFLRAIRPPMSKSRLALIDRAYAKMDVTGDGVVNLDDLKKTYNVKQHPDYQNGSKNEEDILLKFLAKFEQNGSMDGVLTKDEFIDYYSGVSASIDEDIYFDLMMRKAWKL
ncbi:Calcyphosin-like protein [Halotydeus destructor]|nr:Calcyphosin-like protein [Halotydeus destructor]